MKIDTERLKPALEALYRTYNGAYRDTDPVKFVHRYSGKADREIAGLVAAVLAYGSVKHISSSIARALKPMGPSPHAFVRSFSIRDAAALYRDFVHRFTRGTDILLLLYYLKQVYETYESLEALFVDGYDGNDPTIEQGLCRFVARLLSLDCSPFYGSGLPDDAGVRYLLSSPEHGSACKRMNMFLRWMVRPDDGIDCGMWNEISPARLVLPLDAHTARLSFCLGLTSRQTASWRMALEVTENLRLMSPGDPVKYDFALSRLGILDLCAHRYKEGLCERCRLFNLCTLTADVR